MLMDHLDRAKGMGVCFEGLSLISDLYKEGERDGMTAHQSCLPLEIVKSNLIRKFLVEGISGYWPRASVTISGSKFVGLMARAYYDAFNAKVVERNVLSSECFPLE